jgi:hypothetical protein
VNPGIGTGGEIVDDKKADVRTCVSIIVLLTVTKNIVVTGDCVVRVAVEVAVAVYVDPLGVMVDIWKVVVSCVNVFVKLTVFVGVFVRVVVEVAVNWTVAFTRAVDVVVDGVRVTVYVWSGMID